MFKPSTTPVCESIDPELFFLPDKPGAARYPTVLAGICASCDAKTECLEYSLKWNVNGYWAGTTEADRERLRKKLNIIPESILMPQIQSGGYQFHQEKEDWE